jgi:thiol-disulfide isomerase/thioredoxin
MKSLKITLLVALFWVSGISPVAAQADIPNINLVTIDGDQKSTTEVFNNEQPVVLVFWATWCSHTTAGLSSIQDDYLADWQEDYNIKIIVVSVDDVRSSNRAVVMANSSGWDFDVFLDINGDFKRAMGVNSAPYVFILNKDGVIVWQKGAFMVGDEDIIEEELSKM